VLAGLLVLTACTADRGRPEPPTSTTSTSSSTTTTTATSVVTTTTAAPPATIAVRYRIERHTTDDATASFAHDVESTLADARGWSRARFDIARDDTASYVVVLAEGDEVDRLCLPYDTYGKYSCQNGPVVALNADRWRTATPKWTGDLATYRQMLVNHEFGHLLGQKHPRVQCPQPGELAPIMSQQSTELDGCLPNPWPLQSEVDRAARHDRPLAPPYGA
jgi:hypothetical protein